jgi:hypothetical protein
MNTKIIPGAFALILASGAALGQSVSPGAAQLAASAGVTPGVYTTAQMVQIIDARHDHDTTRLAYLLNQTIPVATRASFTAAIPATGPDGLTLTEEIQLQNARRDHERATETFILTGANRSQPLPASAVTPGKAQMAAILGVNPADYTWQQLVAMDHVTDF